jgi:hypothetical protein
VGGEAFRHSLVQCAAWAQLACSQYDFIAIAWLQQVRGRRASYAVQGLSEGLTNSSVATLGFVGQQNT